MNSQFSVGTPPSKIMARSWAVLACVMTGIIASAATAAVMSLVTSAQIRQLERQHYMNRHRDGARLIMWASAEGKTLSPRIFDTWLPIAVVTDLPDGNKKYRWINYTAASDSPGTPEGDQAGGAWIILDGSGCIREMNYTPYDY